MFAIERTTKWYGAKEKTSMLMDNDTGRVEKFETYEEAENFIEKLESRIYRLRHNESGSPDYEIIGCSPSLSVPLLEQ